MQPAIRPALRRWSKTCLDVLLPRHCVLCGQSADSDNLCAPCGAYLPRPGHACLSCALPLSGTDDPLCGPCLRRPPPWDRALGALVYHYPVDRLVCRFKFRCDFSCGHLLGLEMLKAIRFAGLPLPDMLVPVPLHRKRHFSRTFNQADMLARQLGRDLAIPVHSRLLSRQRPTRAQSGLDAINRKRNIRGAFQCHRHARQVVGGAHVALVDDVMTTGATLAECTKTLKRGGTAQVTLWVAARAPGA